MSNNSLARLLFDPFFGEDFDFGKLTPSVQSFDLRHPLKTDVKETKDNIELVMDMPGINKDDVEIELKDNVLTITANTVKTSETKSDVDTEAKENEEVKYLRRERFEGTISRSFAVAPNVKEADISAKFDNGILTVTIKKTESEKKTIKIN